ncbi:hypothetical protein EG329_008250 [Mollisiaceae sp. DMI_Dod_QoI]|nr:hypothetical protein EG329_008250 [Helotiales sp. DMI_Dod_QoI]
MTTLDGGRWDEMHLTIYADFILQLLTNQKTQYDAATEGLLKIPLIIRRYQVLDPVYRSRKDDQGHLRELFEEQLTQMYSSILQFLAQAVCQWSVCIGLGAHSNNPQSAISSSKMDLLIIVTSRPYENIDRRFKSLTNAIPTIRLRGEEESKAIAEEINLVIQALVPDLAVELDLFSSVEQHLLDRLLNIPNRTYLWLHLIINQIRISSGVSTAPRLIRIINEIPATVESAYEEILNKSTDIDLAKRLLHIHYYRSHEAASLDEINVALNIQQQAHTLEYLELESRDKFYGTVRNLCGLFVSIVDSQVFLIHQSAREYLQAGTHPAQAAASWKNCVDMMKAEDILADCCMRYLMFEEFRNRRPPGLRVEDSGEIWWDSEDNGFTIDELRNIYEPLDLDRYPFLQYAALYWPFYYTSKRGDELNHMAMTLSDPDSDYFPTWFCIWLGNSFMNAAFWGTDYHLMLLCTHLMVASILGLEVIVEELAQNKGQINATIYGFSALSFATLSGRSPVVTSLLDAGAATTVIIHPGKCCAPPLSVAIRYSRGTAELLLRYGASVHDRWIDYSGNSWSPLEIAVLYGIRDGNRCPIAESLIKRGADINPEGRVSALQLAVLNNDFTMVELLLNNGSNVNHNPHSITPPALYAATMNGNLKMMAILLDSGADVNIEANQLSKTWGQTSLYLSAKLCNVAAVELLLKQPEINVNAGHGCHGSSLQTAVLYDNLEVVQMLLDHGADINLAALNCYGVPTQSPLKLALSRGYLAISELLLGAGAMVDSVSSVFPLIVRNSLGNLEMRGLSLLTYDDLSPEDFLYAKEFLGNEAQWARRRLFGYLREWVEQDEAQHVELVIRRHQENANQKGHAAYYNPQPEDRLNQDEDNNLETNSNHGPSSYSNHDLEFKDEEGQDENNDSRTVSSHRCFSYCSSHDSEFEDPEDQDENIGSEMVSSDRSESEDERNQDDYNDSETDSSDGSATYYSLSADWRRPTYSKQY